MALTILSMQSGWRSTFGAISFYYDLILMGHVPLALNHHWNQKGGMVIVLLVQD